MTARKRKKRNIYVAFREAAKKAGFGVNEILDREDWRRTFFFDLNYGPVSAPADVIKVKSLIAMAKRHAKSGGRGEHRPLLQLVALKCTIMSDCHPVKWERQHYVRYEGNEASFITLKEWLQDPASQVREDIFRMIARFPGQVIVERLGDVWIRHQGINVCPILMTGEQSPSVMINVTTDLEPDIYRRMYLCPSDDEGRIGVRIESEELPLDLRPVDVLRIAQAGLAIANALHSNPGAIYSNYKMQADPVEPETEVTWDNDLIKYIVDQAISSLH